jgi:hypothetical protein
MRAYRSIQEHTLKQQVETLFSLPAILLFARLGNNSEKLAPALRVSY